MQGDEEDKEAPSSSKQTGKESMQDHEDLEDQQHMS